MPGVCTPGIFLGGSFIEIEDSPASGKQSKLFLKSNDTY
jgi:hypothetical protein